MVDPELLWTRSLRDSPHGAAIVSIVAAALQAASPDMAVRRAMRVDAGRLHVHGREYDLASFVNVHCLAIGKAASAMCGTARELLDGRVAGALAIVKHAAEPAPVGVTVIEGGHPVPDARSLAAGKAAVDFLSRVGPDDLLICMISGGGSALVASPPDALELDHLRGLTSALLASGAAINEINTLRRRLDRLKGGGMAQMVAPAHVIGLILSDVVANPLEAIASGPTAPDPTRRGQALEVIDKYDLRARIDASILRALEQGGETPKPGDPIFERVQNVLIGSNLIAAQAALGQAKQEGFNPYLLGADLHGEASQVGFECAQTLRWAWQRADPAPRPACLITGGETTVTLHGDGRGGRNQELALAAVQPLADFPDVLLLSMATDGEDGPTDAAGAVVTGETYRRAAALGMRPEDFLHRNDSYAFFAALEDLIKPGPTGTNVNDLTFLFTF